jgi:hypothetical protein
VHGCVCPRVPHPSLPLPHPPPPLPPPPACVLQQPCLPATALTTTAAGTGGTPATLHPPAWCRPPSGGLTSCRLSTRTCPASTSGPWRRWRGRPVAQPSCSCSWSWRRRRPARLPAAQGLAPGPATLGLVLGLVVVAPSRRRMPGAGTGAGAGAGAGTAATPAAAPPPPPRCHRGPKRGAPAVAAAAAAAAPNPPSRHARPPPLTCGSKGTPARRCCRRRLRRWGRSRQGQRAGAAAAGAPRPWTHTAAHAARWRGAFWGCCPVPLGSHGPPVCATCVVRGNSTRVRCCYCIECRRRCRRFRHQHLARSVCEHTLVHTCAHAQTHKHANMHARAHTRRTHSHTNHRATSTCNPPGSRWVLS